MVEVLFLVRLQNSSGHSTRPGWKLVFRKLGLEDGPEKTKKETEKKVEKERVTVLVFIIVS